MAHVVVLGAGVAGHTATSFLRKWLDKSPGYRGIATTDLQLDSFQHLARTGLDERRTGQLSTGPRL